MVPETDPPPAGTLIRRHRLATRVWHWLTAVSIFILLGSGLGISNAHGRLYWGSYGANPDPAWATVPHFPGWITIPASYNLAISRRWHLFFALVLGFALLGFMLVSLVNRHFQRDLAIRAHELSPANLAEDTRRHLALKFHDPAAPRDYNIFQKLSYVLIIFVALPLALLTGIALSPGMDAAWPWVLEVLGGRQTARSIHFITAIGIGLFTVVHLALVILAGAGNELRSMITGRWRVPR